MLKDIVVNLATDGSADPATSYALSIAETFKAHLTGIAFALLPVISAPVMGGGIAMNILDGAIAENQRSAKTAVERFEAAARKRSLPTTSRQISSHLAEAADGFGKLARCFDLSVVAQNNPDQAAAMDLFVEAALFGSGRPALVVPYIQKEPLKLDRVICCWDGSMTAARAIADAMPFLKTAAIVDLLMVATERFDCGEIIGVDMAEHLARRDLKVNLQRISALDIDVTSAILSFAADKAADLLVMGAYGHSRLREFVLGGATRGILSSMTVPVLMAH